MSGNVTLWTNVVLVWCCTQVLSGISRGLFLQTVPLPLVTKKQRCYSGEVKIIATDARFLPLCHFLLVLHLH